MRNQCCMSLPHFDYLAQLHRFPLGLSMRVLPRYLMVADGNVIGLTDDLEKNGLVVREHSTEDRRSCYVRLTPDGRTRFEKVATVHEEWVIGCFAALKTSERDLLNASLGKVRVHWSQFFDDKPAAGAVSAREFGAARSEGIG